MDHEHVGKTCNREPQIVVKPLAPSVLQAQTAATLWVKAQHRATNRIEPCRQHEHVDRVFSVPGHDASFRKSLDRLLAQID